MNAWVKPHEFRRWWNAAPTRRQHVAGALLAGWALLCLGLIGRLVAGPLPLPLATVALWAFAFLGVGMLLGAAFPKPAIVLCFPVAWLTGWIVDGL